MTFFVAIENLKPISVFGLDLIFAFKTDNNGAASVTLSMSFHMKY